MSNKLDLHGIRHQDVDLLVENFVYSNQYSFPLIIICGNSVRMIDLTKTVLDRLNCDYSMYRYGILNVHRMI